MKTAILIDDEHYCNETLDFELKRSNYPIDILSKCSDSREAKDLIIALKPDIVFLDIEMPWISGFELLDSLDTIDFHLVFVTAYDQFALKAFEYFAINYLLKPVNKDALNKTLEKIEAHKKSSGHDMSTVLAAFNKTKSNSELIALPVTSGFEFLQQKDILRCEADSNYCTIYFENSKPILISKSLKVIEELLDDRFYRVHQSHLINTHKLRKLDKADGGFVELTDGSKIPISRLKKGEFLRFIR